MPNTVNDVFSRAHWILQLIGRVGYFGSSHFGSSSISGAQNSRVPACRTYSQSTVDVASAPPAAATTVPTLVQLLPAAVVPSTGTDNPASPSFSCPPWRILSRHMPSSVTPTLSNKSATETPINSSRSSPVNTPTNALAYAQCLPTPKRSRTPFSRP